MESGGRFFVLEFGKNLLASVIIKLLSYLI
jgi:hypothetical protein